MFGADKYKNDPDGANKLLVVAAQKAKQRGALRGVWDDIATLIALIKAYFKGSYRDVSWKTIAVALGALIYFVAPLDGMPDFIPFIGYVDDAFVLTLVLKRLREEITAFRKAQSTPTP